MTRTPGICETRRITASLRPSLRYSDSWSSPGFWKGSTAIEEIVAFDEVADDGEAVPDILSTLAVNRYPRRAAVSINRVVSAESPSARRSLFTAVFTL